MSTTQVTAVSSARARQGMGVKLAKRINRGILYLIALILVTVFMGPFLWTLGSSLKTVQEIATFPHDPEHLRTLVDRAVAALLGAPVVHDADGLTDAQFPVFDQMAQHQQAALVR